MPSQWQLIDLWCLHCTRQSTANMPLPPVWNHLAQVPQQWSIRVTLGAFEPNTIAEPQHSQLHHIITIYNMYIYIYMSGLHTAYAPSCTYSTSICPHWAFSPSNHAAVNGTCQNHELGAFGFNTSVLGSRVTNCNKVSVALGKLLKFLLTIPAVSALSLRSGSFAMTSAAIQPQHHFIQECVYLNLSRGDTNPAYGLWLTPEYSHLVVQRNTH